MDPYIGEIRLFAGSYAPQGWAFCNGDTLQVYQNQALYTIIGNMYGGTAGQTFNLPDLRGTVPMHWGTGAGLTPRKLPETGGTQTETITLDQMPNHTHSPQNQTTANETNPNGAVYANSPGGKFPVKAYSQNADTPMNVQAISAVGGNQAHNNMQPTVAINFIIALEGVYPLKSE
ncbi:phage tail protein [Paenibacillus cymbidii]|uniref:phage tail protein n=1 Tax=Paenibacillus cymbidii TaxID=1639034 RepID=UPI001A9B9400|nr:tail fiber protein [Paenibacillus cymbidii]